MNTPLLVGAPTAKMANMELMEEVRNGEALVASELSYRRLFEAAQDGILILDVYRAYDLGANAFLVKPASAEKLTEIVRALDLFWLRNNKYRPLS